MGETAARNAMEILQIERQRDGADIQARLPLDLPLVRDARVKLALLLMEELAHQKGDVEAIAKRVGVSSRQLERLFNQELGHGPSKALQRIRLEKARLFVEHTSQSIMQIAVASGYESQTHFSRMFRSQFGVNPSELRVRTNGLHKSVRTEPEGA